MAEKTDDSKGIWFNDKGFKIIIGIIIFFTVLIAITVESATQLSNNVTLVVEVGIGIIVAIIVFRTTKKSEYQNDVTLAAIKNTQEFEVLYQKKRALEHAIELTKLEIMNKEEKNVLEKSHTVMKDQQEVMAEMKFIIEEQKNTEIFRKHEILKFLVQNLAELQGFLSYDREQLKSKNTKNFDSSRNDMLNDYFHVINEYLISNSWWIDEHFKVKINEIIFGIKISSNQKNPKHVRIGGYEQRTAEITKLIFELTNFQKKFKGSNHL